MHLYFRTSNIRYLSIFNDFSYWTTIDIDDFQFYQSNILTSYLYFYSSITFWSIYNTDITFYTTACTDNFALYSFEVALN